MFFCFIRKVRCLNMLYWGFRFGLVLLKDSITSSVIILILFLPIYCQTPNLRILINCRLILLMILIISIRPCVYFYLFLIRFLSFLAFCLPMLLLLFFFDCQLGTHISTWKFDLHLKVEIVEMNFHLVEMNFHLFLMKGNTSTLGNFHQK